MKKLVILFIVFLITLPAYAVKIKIKSAYKIDAAQEAVVKLNQKAMAEHNVFVVPRGRRIHSRLNDNISRINSDLSEETKKGDIITTQLMQDWCYKDKIVAPEGSLVRGKITDISSNRSTRICFDTIIRPDGVEISIVTKPILMSPQEASENTLIPFGTEFTIQIVNDVITSPY